MISLESSAKSNLREQTLHSFKAVTNQVVGIDSDPHIFPQLRQYLREKLAENLRFLMNHFFQYEDQKFLNKTKDFKQIKAVFAEPHNSLAIENQMIILVLKIRIITCYGICCIRLTS